MAKGYGAGRRSILDCGSTTIERTIRIIQPDNTIKYLNTIKHRRRLGRQSKAEFARFLRIEFGSSCELETQLLIAQKHYKNIDYMQAFDLIKEVQKMTLPLIKRQRIK